MNIIVLKSAQKEIKKLDSRVKERVKTGIMKLPAGDVKALQGYKNMYRLRIGNYRVIFRVDNDTYVIYAVRPRGQAYNDL